MAPTNLSETRADMALAAFEIAVNSYALAFELEHRWSRLRVIAADLRAAALCFECMKKIAESDRPIDPGALESLGELFNVTAQSIHELVDIARELHDAHTLKAGILAGHAQAKIEAISGFTEDAVAILEMRFQ